MKEKSGQIGGWEAPCAPIDYRKLEQAARQECAVLKGCLERLKREPLREGEKELVRRREIRMISDMYYEQRSDIRLFQARADRAEVEFSGKR